MLPGRSFFVFTFFSKRYLQGKMGDGRSILFCAAGGMSGWTVGEEVKESHYQKYKTGSFYRIIKIVQEGTRAGHFIPVWFIRRYHG
jgi:hypothetical protein